MAKKIAKKVALKSLSQDDLLLLKQQWEKEKAEQEKKIQDQRKGYKNLVNEIIPGLFKDLKEASALLSTVKKRVYDGVADLVKTKATVYDRKEDQASHSFTADDGSSITIGYREIDGYDDTVEVGIEKIKDYINSLARDENSKKLVNVILRLLARDKSGSLKASRVLQLQKMAEDTGDAGFLDGIHIIQSAYRPKRTRLFVTASYKGDDGATIELPLNITDAEMMDK